MSWLSRKIALKRHLKQTKYYQEQLSATEMAVISATMAGDVEHIKELKEHKKFLESTLKGYTREERESRCGITYGPNTHGEY
jgi:hypothetical protein